LQAFKSLSNVQVGESRGLHPRLGSLQAIRDAAWPAMYGLCLIASISIWFIAVRAPLWEDEAGSFWQISAGFSAIWSRQFESLSFSAYSYILWLSTKIIGSSELALRVPSILAMLAAVYLLYLAAFELFNRESAIIAAIIFCLHPIVVFASIDIRPYAFGALATNAAILILLRLRRSSSNWLAILFGFAAACIVWFHYLFIVILPALVLCFFAIKVPERKSQWRQFGLAGTAFLFGFLPVIPGLLYLFRTSNTHVYELAPNLQDVLRILAPGRLLPIFLVVIPIALVISAFAVRREDSPRLCKGRYILMPASLAFIPLLLLYGVSVATSLHLFKASHELIAVPGIALCWAFVVNRFHHAAIRLLFCVLLVAATALSCYSSPQSSHRMPSFKYALEFAEKNASVDNAPMLMCSGFVESNYAVMPVDAAQSSRLFAWLSYYKVSVPVVPLPQSLNDEAIRVGLRFLQQATQQHQRFLAVAYGTSDKTLDWLGQNAVAAYFVRKLGTFDGYEVWEFLPRTPAVTAIDSDLD
jgi:hypothetical protein